MRNMPGLTHHPLALSLAHIQIDARASVKPRVTKRLMELDGHNPGGGRHRDRTLEEVRMTREGTQACKASHGGATHDARPRIEGAANRLLRHREHAMHDEVKEGIEVTPELAHATKTTVIHRDNHGPANRLGQLVHRLVCVPSARVAAVVTQHVLAVEEHEHGRHIFHLLGNHHANATQVMLEGKMERERSVAHEVRLSAACVIVTLLEGLAS